MTTIYRLSGSQVTYKSNGTDSLYYTYDPQGQLVSVILNGTEYAYVRNGQNDIIGLIDNQGNQVVYYTYGTWGQPLITTGSLASTLGLKNPYRYRGYRFDTETGLYYLQSRYYNPQWGRFMNADGMVKAGTVFSGYNMFAYCGNNPVNNTDTNGHCWENIFKELLHLFLSLFDGYKDTHIGDALGILETSNDLYSIYKVGSNALSDKTKHTMNVIAIATEDKPRLISIKSLPIVTRDTTQYIPDCRGSYERMKAIERVNTGVKVTGKNWNSLSERERDDLVSKMDQWDPSINLLVASNFGKKAVNIAGGMIYGTDQIFPE